MNGSYAKSSSYWSHFGWGILTSILAGVSVLIYVIIVKAGAHYLWQAPVNYQPFSEGWRAIPIMTAVGLLVGLIHRFLEAKQVDAVEPMVEGRLSPKLLPGTILVSIASLTGGFSLGPEVPGAVLAAGLATWVSERFGLDPEKRKLNVVSGVMSAFGGIFASPTAIVFAPLELPHNQTLRYWGALLITTVAAIIGFAIFVIATPIKFSQTIQLIELPTYDLALWHILFGVIFGILGAGFALVFGIMTRLLMRLAAPLQGRPLVRCGLSGFLIGVLTVALPITMFYGADQLAIVTEHAAEIGVALLLIIVVVKLLVTSGALATGFIGGPVFPLFFIGGTTGMAIHLAFPQIPAALSVASLMAAIPSALLPIPLTLAIIVLFIVGIPVAEAIPVLLAALVAHAVTHGFGLVGANAEEAS